MSLFRALSAVLIIAASLVALPANSMEITKVNNKRIYEFHHASAKNARSYFAGYTLALKLGKVPARLRKLLPISTVSIVYFASNGQLLGWSDKSDKIEVGKWYVQTRGAGNNICILFPQKSGKDSGICTVLSAGTPQFVESTKGNPFGLKGGKPAPYSLGRFGVSLTKAAKKLGL